ncbi:MAG: UvrD-helicase domain-containing protein [Candidatus Helarchaeota archaeon]
MQAANVQVRVSKRFQNRAYRYFRNRQRQLLSKLKIFLTEEYRPGLNEEKLMGRRNLYSIRINDNFRALYSKYLDSGTLIYFFHHIGPHDIYDQMKNIPSGLSGGKDLENFLTEYPLAEKNNTPPKVRYVFDLTTYLTETSEEDFSDNFFDAEIDKFLVRSEEQELIIHSEPWKRIHSLLVQGHAGTGKTTSALFHALYLQKAFQKKIGEPPEILFITYNLKLKKVFSYYLKNLGKDALIKCFTFQEFLRYLTHLFRINDMDYLTRQQTEELLQEVPELTRTGIPLYAFYELFYTIRLALSFDEYRRAIRSREAEINMIQKLAAQNQYNLSASTLQNLYQSYVSTLKENVYRKLPTKDPADLVWDVYSIIIQKKLNLENLFHKVPYIIVDEVQDLRQLEIELLMELLKGQKQKNLNHLALLGDFHQQIMPTDFTWTILQRYIKTKPVELKKNYRNTYEIAQICQILFSLVEDDVRKMNMLEASEHGYNPILIVGEDAQEFVDWLADRLRNGEGHEDIGIISECDYLIKKLESIEDDKDLALILQADEVKGLEFEDMILIQLFGSYNEIFGKVKEIPRGLRDKWYVLVSRARTNLLVFMEKKDLDHLQRFIIPNHYQNFLNAFEVYTESLHWEKAWRIFLSRSSPELPGFARIFFNLKAGETLWNRYKEERTMRRKMKALRRLKKEQAYEEALALLTDIAQVKNASNEEKGYWLVDCAYFAFKAGDSNATRFIDEFLNRSYSVEALVPYILNYSLFDDARIFFLEYLIYKGYGHKFYKLLSQNTTLYNILLKWLIVSLKQIKDIFHFGLSIMEVSLDE